VYQLISKVPRNCCMHLALHLDGRSVPCSQEPSLPVTCQQAPNIHVVLGGGMGGTLLVAQLVEALDYKPEGRGFDSRWCHWIFSLI